MAQRRAAVLLFLLQFSAVWVAACGAGEEAASVAAGPPNVILIVMDTASGERCSVNGYSRETTPHLEEIARGGLNFRNAWAPSGWTGPAHASIFTGLRPEHHGFRRSNRLYLAETSITLAERLRDGGYRTGCFSNNPIVSQDHGLTQGFEHNIPLFESGWLPYPTATPTHQAALSWVRQVSGAGQPFFLFINNMEPHFDYTPPQEFNARFAGNRYTAEEVAALDRLTSHDLFKHNVGLLRIPPRVQSLASDLYDAEIACLDQEIGRLVKKLELLGLLDNTLLVITSDHGENLGRHGLMDHMFSLHRTVLHVPLVIRLPGGARPGEVRNEVARLEDLFPTILEVTSLAVPEGLDGESLLGVMGPRSARAVLDPSTKFVQRGFGEKPGFESFLADLRSEFDGRFHRIDYSDGRRLVFDVLEDPLELHPLDN